MPFKGKASRFFGPKTSHQSKQRAAAQEVPEIPVGSPAAETVASSIPSRTNNSLAPVPSTNVTPVQNSSVPAQTQLGAHAPGRESSAITPQITELFGDSAFSQNAFVDRTTQRQTAALNPAEASAAYFRRDQSSLGPLAPSSSSQRPYNLYTEVSDPRQHDAGSYITLGG